MVHAPAVGGSSFLAVRSSPADGSFSNGASQERTSRTGSTAGATAANPGVGNTMTKPLSTMKAMKLDMATVERRGQPNMAKEAPKTTRLFGLEEAPTFRPSAEEFQNPIEYIKKLSEQGKRYGIIKIIPPDEWNPELAIDTEHFHFRTRRQELNIVEGGTRANLNYLDQLAKFHKQRNGTNLNRFPSVDKRPLDLYKLKNLVESQGGFERVCKGKKWAEIGRLLGYSGKIMSSLSTSLKNSYQKWLLPFEEYLAQVKPGVRQQQEYENGGPYTPSPSRSPLKIHQHTPSSMNDSPALRASAALNQNVHLSSPQAPLPLALQQSSIPLPLPPNDGARPVTGFNAVNSGFTPVNAGFTAVNIPQQIITFSAVNGTNGNLKNGVRQSTPDRSFDGHAPPMHRDKHLNDPVTLESTAHALPIEMYDPSSSKRPLPQEDEMDRDSGTGRRSKRLKQDGAPTVAGSHMTQPRLAATRPFMPRDRTNDAPGTRCETCGQIGDATSLALCDGCEHGYHPRCLEPPLAQVSQGDWFCPRCLVGTGEFGFEEGGIYSLRQFQAKAQAFKDNHFATRLPPGSISGQRRPLTEDDVEREFWRLTESLTETVEVEYGADIHTHISGSGFPTLEKHPHDPYASDGWNLNNLPLDKDSLFRHIKTDISGMTVPWLYAGMCFSCFCWHAEDHNTYSANYQHFGATKTWYGVPAADAEKLEAAMREAVPDLFEANPDLLFQLTTLLTPERLKNAGVRVYALDQRAGQFVITFPQAYHSGFNHGFNFNEAVNFAPSDWEPYGEEAVRKLRFFRRQPVFCHDELLLSAAARDHSIKTARWLGSALERMAAEEQRLRSEFVLAHKGNGDHTCSLDEPINQVARCDLEVQQYPQEELGEDEHVCSYCKAFTHLSRYVCKVSGSVLCLEHAGTYECCETPIEDRLAGRNGQHTVQFRLDQSELTKTVEKVTDIANTPENWTGRLDKLLDEGPNPSLKSLRTLLLDGEKINTQWELAGLPDLRQFVDRCIEWVEDATNYTTRKQQNRRKNERAWRKSSTAKAAEQEEREKEMRNVNNIRRLLKAADHIGFDCPEIQTLREKDEAISEFRSRARDITSTSLSNRNMSQGELEDLVEVGRSFNVDIPEVDVLEKMIKQRYWLEQAQERQKPGKMGTLQDVSDFIGQGLDFGISDTDPLIVLFKEKRNLGEFWENKAKEIMEAENVHYQQLAALSTQASDLPVSPVTLARVETILKKQKEAQEQIVTLYEKSKASDIRQRPTYKQVKEAMDALNELTGRPHGTLDLEREQKRHEDWMRRGKKLFGKANAPLHILLQHMSYVEARNEACFDLTDIPRMPVEPSSREPSPAPQGEEGPEVSATSTRDVFCICRKPEAGMMIECNLCHEWYHGKCLKIARGKVKEEDMYTCPICDYRVKIPRDAARPRLEDLLVWQTELEDLPFQPEEEDCLNNIIDQALKFRQAIAPIINNFCSTPDDLQQQRFYLRKIEGADVLLVEETNFLRAELHKWAPVAPAPPPMTEHSLSTRKPRPTKQQKIMKELGINNPDDLPTHLKAKKTVARKNSEPQLNGRGSITTHSPDVSVVTHASRIQHKPGTVILPTADASRHGKSVHNTPTPARETGASPLFQGPNAAAAWTHNDGDMFANQTRDGFSAAAETTLDPALFEPTSLAGNALGHTRHVSDAGSAPSFGVQGYGSSTENIMANEGEAEMFAQSLASEALGLTGTDFVETDGSQARRGAHSEADSMDDYFA